MKELETQFMKLKEELLNEKLLLIDQKLKEIDDETAEEYTIPCQKLKQNMELKLKLTSTSISSTNLVVHVGQIFHRRCAFDSQRFCETIG
jgi:hypothetical protein